MDNVVLKLLIDSGGFLKYGAVDIVKASVSPD
jgi:hypothetical protein